MRFWCGGLTVEFFRKKLANKRHFSLILLTLHYIGDIYTCCESDNLKYETTKFTWEERERSSVLT